MAAAKKLALLDIPAKVTPLVAGDPVPAPSAMGATFAERKAARAKAVQSAENKAVTHSESK